MPALPQETHSITLMGQTLRVRCPADEVQTLEACGEWVDAKLKAMAGDKPVSLDRLALTASLEIARELMILRRERETYMTLLGRQLHALQKHFA